MALEQDLWAPLDWESQDQGDSLDFSFGLSNLGDDDGWGEPVYFSESETSTSDKPAKDDDDCVGFVPVQDEPQGSKDTEPTTKRRKLDLEKEFKVISENVPPAAVLIKFLRRSGDTVFGSSRKHKK